jgi:hypothetical protein
MPPTYTQIKKNPGVISNVTGSYVSPVFANVKYIICPIHLGRVQTGDIFKTLSKRWISVGSKLTDWFASQRNFHLGQIMDVMVQTDTFVVLALVADGKNVINKEAYKKALQSIAKLSAEHRGNINISHEIIDSFEGSLDLFKEIVTDNGINLVIYTPEGFVKEEPKIIDIPAVEPVKEIKEDTKVYKNEVLGEFFDGSSNNEELKEEPKEEQVVINNNKKKSKKTQDQQE